MFRVPGFIDAQKLCINDLRVLHIKDMNAYYACINFWRAMLDCHCYGQYSHENESRTEIRREPFIYELLLS